MLLWCGRFDTDAKFSNNLRNVRWCIKYLKKFMVFPVFCTSKHKAGQTAIYPERWVLSPVLPTHTQLVYQGDISNGMR